MIKKVATVLLLCGMAFGQTGIVSEAQKKRDTEKHECLVQKAKQLLEQKEELQAQLAEVEKNLQLVESGVLPKEPKDTSSGSGYISTAYSVGGMVLCKQYYNGVCYY